ncbi:hypothetical protein PUN28_006023 [Cardiocondyla obscurior]|uniref:Uncharacterized protein n=1 Tax=Cardiocondyla obscurior TaxID=286306 RepID=A0AAW2G8G0_9HYME
MNMDSLPLHLVGSSSIYAGASSRRSTEPFTRESRKNAQGENGLKQEIGISRNLIRHRGILFADRHFVEATRLKFLENLAIARNRGDKGRHDESYIRTYTTHIHLRPHADACARVQITFYERRRIV